MSRWLDRYKNSPETPIRETDNADIAKVVDATSDAERVITAIRQNGYAHIHSDTLNEVVIFAADEAAAARVRETDPGKVVYLLDELQELIRDDRLTGADLKYLHNVKRLFNGTVVKNNQRW